MGILRNLLGAVFGESKPKSPEEVADEMIRRAAETLREVTRPQKMADFLKDQPILPVFHNLDREALRRLAPGESMEVRSWGNLFCGEPEATIVRIRTPLVLIGPNAFGAEYAVYSGRPKRGNPPDLSVSTDCIGDVIQAIQHTRGYVPEDQF